MKGNDLPGFDIHGQPYPLLIGLLLDEADQFIGFDLQGLDHDLGSARDRPYSQMFRQVLETGDQNPQ